MDTHSSIAMIGDCLSIPPNSRDNVLIALTGLSFEDVLSLVFESEASNDVVDRFIRAMAYAAAAIQRAAESFEFLSDKTKIEVLFRMAREYAKVNHYEYIVIYNRTKKARTKKKYRDKIINAYLKEFELEG